MNVIEGRFEVMKWIQVNSLQEEDTEYGRNQEEWIAFKIDQHNTDIIGSNTIKIRRNGSSNILYTLKTVTIFLTSWSWIWARKNGAFGREVPKLVLAGSYNSVLINLMAG